MKEFNVYFHTEQCTVVTVKAETAEEAAQKVIDWDLTRDEWDSLDDEPTAPADVVIDQIIENVRAE